MAFGLNRAEIIGRLGDDVNVNHLFSGGRVANLSVATDESYVNRQTGERVDKTEWHRIVTFQDGLIDMLEKHVEGSRTRERMSACEWSYLSKIQQVIRPSRVSFATMRACA